MTAETYQAYKVWASSLFDRDRPRVVEAVCAVIESDARVTNKLDMIGAFRVAFSGSVEDPVKLKESLLVSPDDKEHLMGIVLHNALAKLYLADNDDATQPSEAENVLMRKQVDLMRKNTGLSDKPADVFITPEMLERGEGPRA